MRLHKHAELVEAMEYAIAATTQRSNTGWNHKSLATAALDAMLEAAVELGVGKHEPSHKQLHYDNETSNFYHTYYPALILRMEATDDA